MSEITPQTDLEYDGFDLESLADLHRYQRWILSNFEPYLAGSVVEIGAGTGAVSAHLVAKSSELTLVEPSAPQAEHLRRRFADFSHVVISEDSLEAQVARFPTTSIDGVVMVNVLEHIEDDISALREIHRSLKTGGHLMIMVPALPFLFSKMDVRLGHHRRYLAAPLRSMLETAGFEVIAAKYMDLIGIVPWWLINTLAGQTEFNPFLVKIYDIVFVPISRFIEAIVTPPVGKNIVIVARRAAVSEAMNS